MRRYSGSPSDGYTSRPPAFAWKTPRACWSTPTGPAGHEPRVALLAGPGGGGSPDAADHRGDASRRRDRPRLAHGRRRLSAVHGRSPCAARLREDGGPRRPGLRAWRGPGGEPARSARPARRQHPARPGRGRRSRGGGRRGRRLPRVDPGRSGHAPTCAGSRNSTPAGRGVRARTTSRAPSGIWPSSAAAAARGRRSRVPRARSWPARRSGCGATGGSRGTGAGAPTAPS